MGLGSASRRAEAAWVGGLGRGHWPRGRRPRCARGPRLQALVARVRGEAVDAQVPCEIFGDILWVAWIVLGVSWGVVRCPGGLWVGGFWVRWESFGDILWVAWIVLGVSWGGL